jgi:hypothetical protein
MKKYLINLTYKHILPLVYNHITIVMMEKFEAIKTLFKCYKLDISKKSIKRCDCDVPQNCFVSHRSSSRQANWWAPRNDFWSNTFIHNWKFSPNTIGARSAPQAPSLEVFFFLIFLFLSFLFGCLLTIPFFL